MYLSAPRAVMASFARLFPDTTTLKIGTAICPKLPEPPGMKRALTWLRLQLFCYGFIGSKACKGNGCSCVVVQAMSHVGKSAFLYGYKLGKGSQSFYWNAGIYFVSKVESLYFATYLFHLTRAFVTHGKRHLVVLDQAYASFEVQNIDRVHCSSLYSDQYFVFPHSGNRDVIYLDLYLFTISLYLGGFHGLFII